MEAEAEAEADVVREERWFVLRRSNREGKWAEIGSVIIMSATVSRRLRRIEAVASFEAVESERIKVWDFARLLRAEGGIVWEEE